MASDSARWHCVTTVERYDADLAELIAELGKAQGERVFHELHRPYDVQVIDGNILVTAGIQLLEDLLIGAAGTNFSNANARIGVGDSAAAAAVGQTDLQAATNKLRKAMDATFPSRASTTVSWKSSFATTEANYVWNEWAVFNAAAAGTMLNRKVEALGTKASGTWTLETAVVIS